MVEEFQMIDRLKRNSSSPAIVMLKRQVLMAESLAINSPDQISLTFVRENIQRLAPRNYYKAGSTNDLNTSLDRSRLARERWMGIDSPEKDFLKGQRIAIECLKGQRIIPWSQPLSRA